MENPGGGHKSLNPKGISDDHLERRDTPRLTRELNMENTLETQGAKDTT